ncbi:MAG: hypothetical protein KAV68_03415 [Dehalococcoidales bacterium]|nr:hypothetical protein [Dehalococcoidales bacterium]
MNEETVLLIIKTTGAKALCFTTNRMIVAEVGEPSDAYSAGYAPFASLARDLWRGRRIRKIMKLSPEGILTANKKNFAVSYAEIVKVELFVVRRDRMIRIRASADTYEYLLAKPKEFQNYANVLRPVLADKLAGCARL